MARTGKMTTSAARLGVLRNCPLHWRQEWKKTRTSIVFREVISVIETDATANHVDGGAAESPGTEPPRSGD